MFLPIHPKLSADLAPPRQKGTAQPIGRDLPPVSRTQKPTRQTGRGITCRSWGRSTPENRIRIFQTGSSGFFLCRGRLYARCGQRKMRHVPLGDVNRKVTLASSRGRTQPNFTLDAQFTVTNLIHGDVIATPQINPLIHMKKTKRRPQADVFSNC
jgi:hypothetical protein